MIPIGMFGSAIVSGGPQEVWYSDFSEYAGTGVDFLPQPGWTANDWADGGHAHDSTWKTYNSGGLTVLYNTGSPTHLHYDTGRDTHEVEALVKLSPSANVGGVMVGGSSESGEELIYVGFELVLHDGTVPPGFPEDKIVVYYRDGGTHDEYHVETSYGLEFEQWYKMRLRIDSDGTVKAWLDDVHVVTHALDPTQAASLDGHTRAGVINYLGTTNYDWVAVREIVPSGGSESGPSAPGAPTDLSAIAGDTEVQLSWTAPVDDGGAAITDYVIQYRTTAGPGSWDTFADGTSTSTSATVTGLTNGVSYDFQVAAVNSAGTGAFSATATATPVEPAAPEISDSFTYSNGRLQTVSSGVWNDSGSEWNVSSNRVVWTADTSSGLAFHQTQVSAADHFAQVTVNPGTSEYAGGGVLVRGNGNPSAPTGYRIELGVWNNGGTKRNVSITRYDGSTSGSEVHVAAVGGLPGTDDKLRVEVNGSVISVYVNDSLVTTYSSASSYTTQRYVGLYAGRWGGGAPGLDNFEAGALE